MEKRDFTTISIKLDTKERLDRFRQSDRGPVKYEDAIKALLDFWDEKHK